MPKNTSSQIFGRLGELRLAIELEEQGFPVAEVSSRDFGIDLSLMVPEEPLSSKTVAQIKKSKQVASYAISAQFIHVQVKNTEKMKIKREHLSQWAAALDKGAVIVLAFVRKDYIEIFPPNLLSKAYDKCCNKETNSISMKKFRTMDSHDFSNRSSKKLTFENSEFSNQNALGLFIYSLLIQKDIELDLASLLSVDQTLENFLSFLDKHETLLKDYVFANYAPGRDLDRALDSEYCEVEDCIRYVTKKLKQAFGLELEDTSKYEENFMHSIVTEEYQGYYRTLNQVGNDYFREVPSDSFFKSFDLLIKIIESSK